mgnify:CR=1 FL=1|tara:strand:+ start:352 stop:1014 length:663 start_codon:yes stop_codon:yes gene_type:complete
MHETVENLIKIKSNINSNFNNLNQKLTYPKIIAVSKTFNLDKIMPLIEYGHTDFGENKVQEALEKWSEIKKKRSINLHLIGKLQTNKVKHAIKIFDFIHSLDSQKLADKISDEQRKQNIENKYFIQVNIGNEKQKSGIEKDNVKEFYAYCRKLNLNIIGLMCIPPFGQAPSKFFVEMKKINLDIGLEHLSMGMSSDYIKAIENNSTYVRVGSSIFGERSR